MKGFQILMLIATFAMVGRTIVLGQPPVDFATLAPTVIRHAELNPDVPIFVPVHPRIATTISFPKAIGEPLGTGFIDAENLAKPGLAEAKTSASGKGEYIIDYEQGDTFFTVQPTPRSELLNLNVPYEGATIVFYFYPVDSPLSALASLILQEKSPGESAHAVSPTERPPSESASPMVVAEPKPRDLLTTTVAKLAHAVTGRTSESVAPSESGSSAVALASRIQKTDAPIKSRFVPVTPARLDGFLRKLRMVHAAQVGPELDELSDALKVTVAISAAESGAASSLAHPVNDAGLYQLVLLRAVRDPALDAVGFVLLMRNISDQSLGFDPRTFSARCGAALYTAQVIDAPATLKPRETQAAYFVIVGSGDGRPGYLKADNDWRISVALVSPRLAPGATLSADVSKTKETVLR